MNQDFTKLSADARSLELVKVAREIISRSHAMSEKAAADRKRVSNALPACMDALLSTGLVTAAKQAELESRLGDHADSLELLTRFASSYASSKQASESAASPALGTAVAAASLTSGVKTAGETMRDADRTYLEALGIHV